MSKLSNYDSKKHVSNKNLRRWEWGVEEVEGVTLEAELQDQRRREETIRGASSPRISSREL